MVVDTANKGAVWPVSRIRIGHKRQNLGDIDALAKSIADLGLLHPIVVRPDGELVAGFRRLKALERLGYVETKVTIANGLEDELRLLAAERDENTCREPLSTADAHNYSQRLLKAERAAAKEREREGQERGREARRTGVAKVAPDQRPPREPKATQKVAAALGMSGRQLEKIEAVHTAAEKAPALAPVVKSMESEDKVQPAYEVATQWTPQQRKTYSKLWSWGWENSEIVRFAKAIEQLPEAEHVQARSLVFDEKTPLNSDDGMRVANNLAAMNSKRRAKVYELWASDDDKDRDAAISLVVGNTPTDPRVPRIVEMVQNLRGFTKRWPDDASNKEIAAAAKILEDLAETLRDRMKERVKA